MTFGSRWLLAVGFAGASVAGVAGCGEGASDAERAACRTFHRFEASSKAEQIQALRARFAQQAAASGNDTIEKESKAFERALGEGEVTAAGESVGRLRTECERLGISADA